MGKKLTHEEFVERLETINPDIEVVDLYNSQCTPFKVRCKKCNYEWNGYASNLLRGNGCRKCSAKKRGTKRTKTHNDFLKEFAEKNPYSNEIILLGKYVQAQSPIQCECKKCKGKWERTPSELLTNKGCPICSGRKVVKGINDVATTHPHLVKYFTNIEESYLYTSNSNQIIETKCPYCNHTKNMRVADLTHREYSCHICGDNGCSYPNRFSYAFLNLLPINNWIKEYSPSWISPKRYDNYFEYKGNKYILEMDGAFHYKDSFTKFKEVQAVDRYKDEIALKHGIETIRIECLKSSPFYIRDNILNSKIAEIFDLSEYNWNECFLNAQIKSHKIIWDYCNENSNIAIKDIANYFNCSVDRIRRIIKCGNEMGTCFYKTKISHYCINVFIENKKIHTFSSLTNCERTIKMLYNVPITRTKIIDVCEGKLSSYKGFTFKYAD